MDLFSGLNQELVKWFLLPLLIFLARILDVSIGTFRIVLVSKGIRGLAAIAGFVEVFIWIIAISQIFQNVNNFLNYFAYASGFATGTYVGLIIESKISIGKVVVRIITRRDATELIDLLINQDYHITVLDAKGRYGDVKVIFMVLQRKEIPKVIRIINEYNPRAFYTIEDIRYVNDLDSLKKINPLFLKFSNILKVFSARK